MKMAVVRECGCAKTNASCAAHVTSHMADSAQPRRDETRPPKIVCSIGIIGLTDDDETTRDGCYVGGRHDRLGAMPPPAATPEKRTTRLLCGHCLGTGRMMADGGAFDVAWRAGDICPTCKGAGVVTIEAAPPARPTGSVEDAG